MLHVASAVLLFQCGFTPLRPPLRASAPRATAPTLLVAAPAELEVWRLREKMARGVLAQVVHWKEDDREAAAAAAGEGVDAATDSTRTAFVSAAAVALLGAFVLRLGGRAALVSVLGLDLVAELGIGDSIDSVIAAADSLGVWAVLAFGLAWVVAKVFLLDFLSIALAFSSGVIFGGVVHRDHD